MDASAAGLRKTEKLVVFDFDDTLYSHSYHQRNNSCHLNDKDVPIFLMSDRTFLERILRGLTQKGIHVGVASFGKKSLIINTMNTLLYGSKEQWAAEPYFNDSNVITVPDLRDEWRATLQRISSTFKEYVKKADGNIDEAFDKFLREKKPEREAKYFCLKLSPAAKVQMIAMICDYYNKLHGLNISLQDVRFFDDDKDNIGAALSTGIMAHLVPAPGLTEAWWKQECQRIDSCTTFEPYFTTQQHRNDLSSSSEYSWGMNGSSSDEEGSLKRSKTDD